MHLTLNAEVVVAGKHTFTNLADVENPAEDFMGIAKPASQGGSMWDRSCTGQVFETVPGVITTQHIGEGKATRGPV